MPCSRLFPAVSHCARRVTTYIDSLRGIGNSARVAEVPTANVGAQPLSSLSVDLCFRATSEALGDTRDAVPDKINVPIHRGQKATLSFARPSSLLHRFLLDANASRQARITSSRFWPVHRTQPAPRGPSSTSRSSTTARTPGADHAAPRAAARSA